MQERILEKNEQEYKNLVAAAKIMEAFSRKGKHYDVGETYLDFGANWKWTTIFRGKRNEHMNDRFEIDCQALCPRDWKAICGARTYEELFEAVSTMMSDKYYSD